MKKYIVFLVGCMLLVGQVHSQDLIVLKDGATVPGRVCEVTSTEIKYKKISNPDGPLYSIDKSRVLAVNYKNGEKESYAEGAVLQNPTAQPVSNRPRKVFVAPADDNAALIAKYNQPATFYGKKKIGWAKVITCKYGITQKSVLSNRDMEIRIEYVGEAPYPYVVKVVNKTDGTLYVDLGNTFRIFKDGTSRRYFDDSEQVTVSHGRTGGGSIGLGSIAGALGVDGVVGTLAGGVVLGGGSQHGASTTYSNPRILVIAPRCQECLATNKEVEVRPGGVFRVQETKQLSYGERFFTPGLTRFTVSKGEVKQYTEASSPDKQKYMITYSTEETFGTYSVVEFTVYLQQLFGGDCMHGYLPTLEEEKRYMLKRVNYHPYMILGRVWPEK